VGAVLSAVGADWSVAVAIMSGAALVGALDAVSAAAPLHAASASENASNAAETKILCGRIFWIISLPQSVNCRFLDLGIKSRGRRCGE
jgi:hypothetical protein